MPFDTTSVVNTAIGALPGILSLIKAQHQNYNPSDPPLTDTQVLEALQSAVASSVAKDEAWLAVHNPTPASPTDTKE
jgi:hypothetical protein